MAIWMVFEKCLFHMPIQSESCLNDAFRYSSIVVRCAACESVARNFLLFSSLLPTDNYGYLITHTKPYRFQFASDKWSFGVEYVRLIHTIPFVKHSLKYQSTFDLFQMNQLASEMSAECLALRLFAFSNVPISRSKCANKWPKLSNDGNVQPNSLKLNNHFLALLR